MGHQITSLSGLNLFGPVRMNAGRDDSTTLRWGGGIQGGRDTDANEGRITARSLLDSASQFKMIMALLSRKLITFGAKLSLQMGMEELRGGSCQMGWGGRRGGEREGIRGEEREGLETERATGEKGREMG